jgi:UDP-glucose 4-epimerase
MAVLVTGGAGYIGSVFVERLQRAGRDVVVLDNLDRGHRAAVDSAVPFYAGNVGDRALVTEIVRRHKVEACVHFAALAYVAESVTEPARYFGNNVACGIGLLDGLREGGVKRVVLSSTCATYGEPQQVPIPEDHPQHPANPYGWSKFFIERILASYDQAYFNAAGATERCGEDHDPETHLIPVVLLAAMGKRDHVSVFGDDYPTPDGTPIRDYIHVVDLCDAHVLALDYLADGGNTDSFNLGTGTGNSVLEVIETARTVTGRPIEARIAPRRAGDPSRLVANAAKARAVLNWQPKYTDLETIVRSAWKWHQAHPNGYA